MTTTANDLIAESINTDTRPAAEYDAALVADLKSLCEDYAKETTNPGWDFWGTNEHGDEWRVFVAAEEA